MSQENVESDKRGFELWNCGDMDALRERYHPEAVMHHPPAWPEPGPSVGRDAIFDQFRRLREDTQANELQVTLLGDPDDWVIWEYLWSATGLESGLALELIGVQAVRHSGGKVVEVRYYTDRGEAFEAFEAFGLRE